MKLIEIAQDLRRAVDALDFAEPVTHVYNPLGYAWKSHALYLERFGGAPKLAMLVGMNPGPFGMAQTGVPFGEIAAVKDWMGIEATVERPAIEHPKRPIEGFTCKRSEVSGRRLWGWAAGRFGTPEVFFARFFVHNYCPLAFMESSGRNFTPNKLPAAEREALFAACDTALRRTVEALDPKLVIGVGAFARDRAREALDGKDIEIGMVLHPSPASPAANRGWAEQAEAQLATLGIDLDGH